MKEWGHTVSVPGAYTMGFLIQLTTFHDLCNLSCEVCMCKVGISFREVSIQGVRCILGVYGHRPSAAAIPTDGENAEHGSQVNGPCPLNKI